MCYNRDMKGRGKPKKNPQPKGEKDNIMKKYIVVMIYSTGDLRTEWETEKEAHDYAMCKWFWGALGAEIYDPSGKCIEVLG